MNKRKCPGCRDSMEGRLIMCADCWRHLPAELRREWQAAKKSGDLEMKRAAARRCLFAIIDQRHTHAALREVRDA